MNLQDRALSRRLLSAALSAGAVAVLSACASIDLTGIGAETTFNCQAPQGVSCLSVSGLYANASAGTLPSQNPTPNGTAVPGSARQGPPPGKLPAQPTSRNSPQAGGVPDQPVSPSLMAAPYSGQPLRAAPKVMRIWVAPVEDSEGDLHDQRFIYVTVSPGRWLIEANRMNIQRQFRPVLQIGQSAADAAGDENEPQAQQPQANNPRANARRSAAEAAASRAPAQGGRPDPASQE